MKIASFDLESAQTIPDVVQYEDQHFVDLGITCAAVALCDCSSDDWSDTDNVVFWHSSDINRLDKADCCEIVHDCMALVKEGYTFLTWNGAGFDFKLLAVQSGMFKECAEIAYWHHIDMMLYPVFIKGHYLGLQKCLDGIGREGKLTVTTLNDGTVIENMKGAVAPDMWAKGEFNAVLEYLNYDVCEPLALLQHMHNKKRIQWISAAGNPQSLNVERLMKVYEMYEYFPDHANWEKFNINKFQFINWMPADTFHE